MLTLKIETKNDATQEPDEIARLVREIATEIAYGMTSNRVYDYNGNDVGSWRLTK